MLRKNFKTAQEEMVGFALIIIIVAVILLVFLGFKLNDSSSESLESYEVESFVQAFLPYTTSCADNYEPNYYTIRELIVACNENKNCLDKRSACEVLNFTMKEIIENSWDVGDERPVRGYSFVIDTDDKLVVKYEKGNVTNNYKSAVQNLGKNDLKITLNIYS